jgi:hypothetical protein
MKYSEKGDKSLISKKTQINPDEVSQDVLGWIDNSLIKDIGQVLHVDLATLPQDSVRLMTGKTSVVPLDEDITESVDFLSDQYKTIRYSPVMSYGKKDSLTALKTRLALPVFDTSNNYIFNVNGKSISHDRFKDLSKSLKKINVVFVLEGKGKTISMFPQIVNALQNLQPLFEEPNDRFSYRFGCVTVFDETGKSDVPVSKGLSSDYSDIMNYLTEKASNKDKLKAFSLNRTWPGLRKAITLFDDCPDETNLIVLIGDAGYAAESTDAALAGKLLKNNCRIVGFQVYAGRDVSYNNFVLDVESMIDSYADAMIVTKGDLLVSPEQVKRTNFYKETGSEKNGFRLDFPDNSITQGFLLFPQKEETLPMDILSNNVDTILGQIKADNVSIINYMSKAFNSAGNNRTRYDTLFSRYYGLDSLRVPGKKLLAGFKNDTPGWMLPSKTVFMNDSVSRIVDYKLMLSENEMEELKEFVSSLSSEEIDYQVSTDMSGKKKKKVCDCPDDDLFSELDVGNQANAEASPEYENTRFIRSRIYERYMQNVRYCKICKEKRGNVKRMSIAEIHRRITGCPNSNTTLNSILLKNIKNKELVTDKILDDLINYFKNKKDDLDKAEKFESNGQTYYWVDMKLLP